ncbi:TPA: C-terminal binding protein [bacterium]|nr:C-terminal binding protein [bacterium]
MSNKNFKVVYTDSYHPTVSAEQAELDEIDAELIVAECKNENETIAICKDADALLVQHAKITKKVIKNLKKCRVIARFGVGYDNVDVKSATEYGIMVANVPDYCIDEVSSQAIALIMALSRKIVLLNNSIKNGLWDHRIGSPIYKQSGQILGIIGLGRIGSVTAKKALGLGFKVQAYDPYISHTDLDVALVDLDFLLQTSDFVSIHTPLNEETYHMIGKDHLKKMKKSAFLINTARGAIIDESALYGALKAGLIAGAGVDVLEQEPPSPDNPLFKLDNFIITPHSAFYSEDSNKLLSLETTRAVVAVLKGGQPRSLVNPEVLNLLNENKEK